MGDSGLGPWEGWGNSLPWSLGSIQLPEDFLGERPGTAGIAGGGVDGHGRAADVALQGGLRRAPATQCHWRLERFISGPAERRQSGPSAGLVADGASFGGGLGGPAAQEGAFDGATDASFHGRESL